MNKIYKTAMSALCLLLLSCAVQAASSWQDTIRKENQRAHVQESFSVLGTRIGWDVARIKAANAADKKHNDFRARKQKAAALLTRYEANLEILQTPLKNNDLFKGYTLTATDEAIFVYLETDQVAELKTFLQGKGEAKLDKYFKNGYTHFSVKLDSVELDICIEIKQITLMQATYTQKRAKH